MFRSCLRCSKCGISLRLNEFRNELKFLCVYCLGNVNISQKTPNFREKSEFLEKIEKIDFRERIEFENKTSDLNIISKTPLNESSEGEDDNDDDNDLMFDDNSSECDINSETSEDDTNNWETTDSDDDLSSSTEDERQAKDDTRRQQRHDTDDTQTLPATQTPIVSRVKPLNSRSKARTSVDKRLAEKPPSVTSPPPVLCRPRTRILLAKLFQK